MKNKISKLIAILLTSLLAVGCMPRGETKTLDQVFADSKTRFESSDKTQVAGDAKPIFDKLVTELNTFSTKDGETPENADKLAASLREITPYAGYTSRAGLDELSQQLVASKSEGARFNLAAAKLLSARIYSALATEVDATHFGVTLAN